MSLPSGFVAMAAGKCIFTPNTWFRQSDDVANQESVGPIAIFDNYRPFDVKILRVNADGYPDALDPNLVGTYSPIAKAGGGYVWDDVLEYRVWCHPERGSPDLEDGSDYYHAFGTYADALTFSRGTEGAEAPVALIRQLEYIAEDSPGEYRHVKEERIAEWPVEFLRRPRRTQNTIPDFLAPDAPANKLDILRGLVRR